jgi:putative photosynthetic complex assembly protein 2
MKDLIIPALFAVVLWWLSTGIILFLDGLPRRTFRWSMLGGTILLAVALQGLSRTGTMPTVAGAYLAFCCGLMVWAWQEMAFLLGFMTGPRKQACAAGCSGWRHFAHAVSAILYHELAILAGAATVAALTWGAPNQVGAWTFFVLWGLRLSAKLNLFLGVRNLNKEWIPDHLGFVKGFLNRRPMNLLFPVSITLSTVIAVYLVQAALAEDATDFEVAGYALIGTLLVLAILEHWFLVLPLPAEALWSWGLRSRDQGKSARGRRADPTGGSPRSRTVVAEPGPLEAARLHYRRAPARRVPADTGRLTAGRRERRTIDGDFTKRRQT